MHRGRGLFFCQESRQGNGIDNAASWLDLSVPAVYSGDLSIFVPKVGVKLLEEMRPGTADANAFMAEVDAAIARLIAQDVRPVLTGDHGMKAKHTADGAPDVIYLKPVLDDLLGAGGAQVILPITDPYVAYHLFNKRGAGRAVGLLKKTAGMDQVLTRAEAWDRFDLPADHIGDLVVTCVAGKALGTAKAEHDPSGLDVPLRSHGRLDEQVVPFILNGTMGQRDNLRNYDARVTAVAQSRCKR